MNFACRVVASAITLLGLAGAGQGASASPVTYTLIPISSATQTLGGFITINDDPTDGKVFFSEIVDWSFSVTGVVNYSLNKSDAGATGGCAAVEPCFTISGLDLLFDFRPRTSGLGPFNNFGVGTPGVGSLLMKNNNQTAGVYITSISTDATVGVSISPDDLRVIARASPATTVSEPSMLALVSLALASQLLVAGRRRRSERAPRA